jgi:hypothetical protein
MVARNRATKVKQAGQGSQRQGYIDSQSHGKAGWAGQPSTGQKRASSWTLVSQRQGNKEKQAGNWTGHPKTGQQVQAGWAGQPWIGQRRTSRLDIGRQ